MRLDDARPDLPGIQVDLLLETSAADGSLVTLSLDGAALPTDSAASKAQGRRASLRGISLPEGKHILAARIVDAVTGLAAESGAELTIVDAPIDCLFRSPQDGGTLTLADDASTEPGFQADISVACRGAAPGSAATLTVFRAVQTTMDLAGEATFRAVELAEAGRRPDGGGSRRRWIS